MKIFFTFVMILFLAGCSLTGSVRDGGVLDENSASPTERAFNEEKLLSEINKYKEENIEVNNTQPTANGVENDKIQLKNLALQYNRAILKTSLGDITVAFYADESPVTVNNFMNLAKKGFYDGTSFHRIISDFMIQGGDPNSKDSDWSNDGAGGPGYSFQDEFNGHKLVRGSLAMANSGPNTNGSQFFIVTANETPWLDGKHTNFGYVVEGMDVVANIEAAETNERDHPLQNITIASIELTSVEEVRSRLDDAAAVAEEIAGEKIEDVADNNEENAMETENTPE